MGRAPTLTAAPPPGSPFHRGESAVQARAGVRAMAERVGGIIAPEISPAFGAFLRTVRVAAVGAPDAERRVWATMLVAAPGFLEAERDALRVGAAPAAGDALRAALGGARGATGAPTPVGVTAIDFGTRRRVRVNGVLADGAPERGARPGLGFVVAVREAYGNCPKYIQARAVPAGPTAAPADVPLADAADRLTDAQQAWLRAADTCFLASVGPTEDGPTEGGTPGRADASHRGGAPGFLAVPDAGRVVLPDYPGNAMFNTLGNLAVDPRVGVVVPDFARGRLLQLSGTAAVDWRPAAAAAFPGAERVVVLTVERVREVAGALPAGWSAPQPSPLNPPAPVRPPAA
ncbi:hypothetical protein tb265_19010 [Gemmatimonadetes bacterium T265]|nr:hypothetical protein tb265_19010 [Gemmatimonadetes bacterium T265]